MRRDKFIFMKLALILLLVALATTGCNSSQLLSGISNFDSLKKSSSKTMDKVDKKWADSLPIDVISIFPNQNKLARVYAKIANTNAQKLDLVKISVMDLTGEKEIASVLLEDLKPGEEKTFEIQTALAITEAQSHGLKVTGIKAAK